MFNSVTYNSTNYSSVLTLTKAIINVGIANILGQIKRSDIVINNDSNIVLLGTLNSSNTLDLSSPNTIIELNSDNKTITL